MNRNTEVKYKIHFEQHNFVNFKKDCFRIKIYQCGF